MTIQRFYHTERRGFIVADIYDLGTKPPADAATGDELLQPERLPRLPPPKRPIPPSVLAVLEAAKQNPGTIADLANRTGFAFATVQEIVQGPHFQHIGSVTIHGRKRKVYGARE